MRLTIYWDDTDVGNEGWAWRTNGADPDSGAIEGLYSLCNVLNMVGSDAEVVVHQPDGKVWEGAMFLPRFGGEEVPGADSWNATHCLYRCNEEEDWFVEPRT